MQEKVHIISLSIYFRRHHEGIYSKIQEVVSEGIHIICAAGNHEDGLLLPFPARYDEVIAVSAINKHLISESGAISKDVDFAGPGVGITSIMENGEIGLIDNAGSSFAAPFVAGIAALILSKHQQGRDKTPIKDVHDLRAHLRKMTADLGMIGPDVRHGYGLPVFWPFLSNEPFIQRLEPGDLTPRGFKKLMNHLQTL